MRKRILSIIFVLCLCIGSVPVAFADGVTFLIGREVCNWTEDMSGNGWKCIASERKLILNNLNGLDNAIDITAEGEYSKLYQTMTVVLENKSKNSARKLDYREIVFEGDGELIIYDRQSETNGAIYPVLQVAPGGSITFKDSLTMMGGQNYRDKKPLKVNEKGYVVTEDGQCAYYVRIAPIDSFNSSFLESQFSDVKKNDWFHDPVSWATKENITGGTSATTFSPNRTCTVGEIATLLWRAAGSPKSTIANPYPDVKESDYYYDAALWGYEKYIFRGVTTFDADEPCTRSMAVFNIWKAAGGNGKESTVSFTDVPPDEYYAKAVSWAVGNNITTGTGNGRFSPEKTCTRAEIVTFLYRCFA